MKKRIGVLLSGRGSNFEALAGSVAAGRIPNAEIAIALSNREDARGIEKARAFGIEARIISSRGLEREAYDKLVVAALQEKRVDLVCLAGYMRLLSPQFVAAFRNRILNIHPSLLPAFPGLEAQRQALEHGAKFSGCTVHFVDENLDAGPIVYCRRAFRLKITTRRKRWPSGFCARSTVFTQRRCASSSKRDSESRAAAS
jgi:phosphoribosylglycinamide formyltransferase-1